MIRIQIIVCIKEFAFHIVQVIMSYGEGLMTMSLLNMIFIVAGLYVILGTVLKLPFYWDARKVQRMRRLLGDTITYFFNLIIGVGLFIVGLLSVLGVINLN
ncbi:hypothetical protein [Sphaerochaeta sp. S2]|uniref:hypothetical protein n=1 Tax=Sphaerochaeta sp. S2 TaxID=2798868 RepID=UPI0018E9B85D|nr:hypothetical protein [Sphaerochaeta sp. S2]MBJ2357144.1 hypothetical protein [Sphaerochaeta sp. S2]